MAVNLKSSIWVAALIRRAESGGAFAALVQRGDADAGAVLVKVVRQDRSAMLYSPARNMDGERVWLPKGPLDEGEIDAITAKKRALDPDIWLVEIEDKDGRHFLTEPVETP